MDKHEDSAACPDIELLDRYLSEEVDAAARSGVEEHLASCDACRERVAELNENMRTLTRAQRLFCESHAPAGDGDDVLPKVPGYEITRMVHRGGQGIVYEARQISTNRSAAVKLLLHGRYATKRERRRFEREIELAAPLDHPNIVTIFDSGVTDDDHLYLVMRYVEGRPLDEYMAGRDCGEGETLELFATIAGAVNHAHQRGMIHRDLKPSNILIGDSGEPHLLDFGLAKPLGEVGTVQRSVQTMAGEFVGTLAYAAPEQVGGDPNAIDVRSDVYALGVILFEMLTGVHPYPVDVQLTELVSNIAQREPARPSSIRREISGELDTIVLKALSKDKERRYQSVGAFIRDLENYRSGRPIEARGDSAWYVLRKAIGRNRAPVAAACIVLLALIGADVTSTVFWRQSVVDRDEAIEAREDADDARLEAEEAQAEAEQRADELEDLALFTSLGVLEAAMPWELGEDATVIQAMDAIAGRLDGKFKDQPQVEIHIRHSIGNIYQENGRYDDAELHLQRAIDLSVEVNGPDANQTLVTKVWLWKLRCRQERYVEAEDLIFEVIERQRRTTGEADCREHYRYAGEMMLELDRLDEAEPLLRKAIDLAPQMWDGKQWNALGAVADLADLFQRQERAEEIVGLCQETLTAIRPLTEAEQREPIRAMREVAWIVKNVAPLELQAPLWRACAQARHLHLTDVNTRCTTVHFLLELGWALAEQKDGEALEVIREATEVARQTLGEDNEGTGLSLVWLGRMLNRSTRYEEAEAPLREALEIYRSIHSEDGAQTVGPRTELGIALIGQGRHEEAESLLRKALSIKAAATSPDDPTIINIQTRLVEALVGQGRSDEGEELAREMLVILIDRYNPHHTRVAKLRHDLEMVLGHSLSS